MNKSILAVIALLAVFAIGTSQGIPIISSILSPTTTFLNALSAAYLKFIQRKTIVHKQKSIFIGVN
jgi:hypothetical protein